MAWARIKIFPSGSLSFFEDDETCSVSGLADEGRTGGTRRGAGIGMIFNTLGLNYNRKNEPPEDLPFFLVTHHRFYPIRTSLHFVADFEDVGLEGFERDVKAGIEEFAAVAVVALSVKAVVENVLLAFRNKIT